MKHPEVLSAEIMDIQSNKFGDQMSEYVFPPPIFSFMEGAFLELDLDGGFLTAQSPVLESYLNPYSTMQGGMIAAAVDSTIKPLSVLVAPPNVTRHLEMTFSRPIKWIREE